MTVGSRLGIRIPIGAGEVLFRIRRWAVVQETRKGNLLRGDSSCFLGEQRGRAFSCSVVIESARLFNL